MPIKNYGVWKAKPVYYEVEDAVTDDISPHLSLYFDDKGGDHSAREFRSTGRHKEIRGLFRAAINIKSIGNESRLAYWVNHNLNNHPIIDSLTVLPLGFEPLEQPKQGYNELGLDYIRSNLFNVNTGRVLPHDQPGLNNDMIDVLAPEVKQAIEQKADIYVFGAQFEDRKGIHDVHMNQGNIGRFQRDDGVFQDGCLLINYPDSGKWVGVFIGFGSQSAHTDDNTGHAIGSETWIDYLRSTGRRKDLVENSVHIDEAFVDSNDHRARRRSVTISNPTGHAMPLSAWKIQNSAGQFQALPPDAALGAMKKQTFDIPHCPLSSIGDTITLVNDEGLKVDGVSYHAQPGGIEGQPVVFAH
ncbi:hypothetical protein PENANT_c040G11611 [Penicillium antarcticum]|uniref:LTD domain-containing protein n=1 Tax=Penicillium antarcticum TaxID=416450 RepID=A0A1V6PSN8_9EURO|nr:uncharacterized protein N7508_000240 [Penicillium antarcticum]KAJ5319957.1 hypothetical protein N7508_000240 [Penicillium antarcticum]OQD80024.1 hypothetical protein PENANT_c040G11611 [Penicillium antarcticum]